MKDTTRGDGGRTPGNWQPDTWYGWLALFLWITSMVVFLQFSVASMQELEPQAAALGWIVVVMLLVGGLVVWSARLESRDRRR